MVPTKLIQRRTSVLTLARKLQMLIECCSVSCRFACLYKMYQKHIFRQRLHRSSPIRTSNKEYFPVWMIFIFLVILEKWLFKKVSWCSRDNECTASVARLCWQQKTLTISLAIKYRETLGASCFSLPQTGPSNTEKLPALIILIRLVNFENLPWRLRQECAAPMSACVYKEKLSFLAARYRRILGISCFNLSKTEPSNTEYFPARIVSLCLVKLEIWLLINFLWR